MRTFALLRSRPVVEGRFKYPVEGALLDLEFGLEVTPCGDMEVCVRTVDPKARLMLTEFNIGPVMDEVNRRIDHIVAPWKHKAPWN